MDFQETIKKKLPALNNLVKTTANRFGVFQLNEKGIISNVFFNTEYDYNFDSLIGKNIKTFYSLPGFRHLYEISLPLRLKKLSLDHTPLLSDKCVYASKNVFERFDLFFGFHTKIPFSFLFLRTFKEFGVLGCVHFTRFAGRLSFIKRNPLVFVDKKGTVQGANTFFINCFGRKNTETILEKPVERFIHPNPMDLLIGHPEEFYRIREEKWKREADPGPAKWFKAKLKRKDEGLVWEPKTERDRLLLFGRPFDTLHMDYKIEIQARILKGNTPSIILNGDTPAEDVFPDHNGYFLGPSADNKHFLIKKGGIVVFEDDFNSPPSNRIQAIEIVKRGHHLAWFLNGRLAAGLRDPDPIDKPGGIQYIYTREQGSILFKSIQVSFLAKRPAVQPPFNEVTLLNKKENVFEFQQLIDRVTIMNKRFYYGIVLHDISHLKENIHFLEKEKEKTERQRDRYRAMALGAESLSDTFVGKAPEILKIKETVRVAAESPVTILIEGKTGTGKAVLAEYIHCNSLYKKGPFVKVDCATLPETLLESELFGHEKGAFTGADSVRVGKLEEADQGTLFLDEVGNLTMSTQAKLLNFLQDFTLQRLGSNIKVKIKTRIIAATNRPLNEMVEGGGFRPDLFYRLNTVRLELPALGRRKEDIPDLCTYFLKVYNKRFKRGVKDLSPGAFQKLMEYEWPGNIRELENVIQKAVLFCEDKIIKAHQIEIPKPLLQTETEPEKSVIPVGNPRALKKEHVIALLEQNNNIIAWAAQKAEVSEATFFRKIKKFNITVKKS